MYKVFISPAIARVLRAFSPPKSNDTSASVGEDGAPLPTNLIEKVKKCLGSAITLPSFNLFDMDLADDSSGDGYVLGCSN